MDSLHICCRKYPFACSAGGKTKTAGRERKMPAYAILRIKKLKSWGDIAGADAHNFRERETLNADEERTQDNTSFIGDAERNSVKAIKAAIGEQKIRKNAVLGVEMLMSASPEYFRPGKEGEAGMYDAGRTLAWGEASAHWLQERYGGRVIKAVMHLDEATPHIHAVLVPLDDRGKLNCRALFGGSRHTLTKLQTDYAKAVESLGLERGLQGSRAKHQEVAKFYAVTQCKEYPPVFRAKSVDIPELPGKVERLSDSALAKFAQQVAASAITAQQSEVSSTLQALTGENALLKRQREELRRGNAALSRELDILKREADHLRGLDLSEVLVKLYGAREAHDSEPAYKTRKFELEDGCKVATTGDLWIDNVSGKGGKGAINLVMHLSGYEQGQYKQAVRELAETFGSDGARRAITRHISDTASQRATTFTEQAIKEPLQLPQPCPETWSRVRGYLTRKRKLPERLVDAAHDKGLVYSDRRGNCVFPCDKESGAFIRGTGSQPFKRTIGQGHLPYALKGTDTKVIVTESAIDALTLKTMLPAIAVIATGGNMPLERLKPYLDGKAVYLAHDNDKAGEAQAARIKEHYPEAQRLVPPQGKDWNDYQQRKAQTEREPVRRIQADMERA